jgi:predicted ArsR family transcriptional regulator
VLGRVRVAQFLAQHDSAAAVSLGREGEQAARLEHPGGRAAHRFEIREIDEGVRRDDEIGGLLLALECVGQVGDEETAAGILRRRRDGRKVPRTAVTPVLGESHGLAHWSVS